MQNLKSYLIIFLILFGNSTIQSQNKEISPGTRYKIDSLKLELKNAKHDTVSLYSCTALSYHYKKINLDSSLYFLSIAEEKAKKLKEPYKIGKVMLRQANIKFLQKKKDEAFEIYKRVDDLTVKAMIGLSGSSLIKMKNLRALGFYEVGEVYHYLNSFEQALEVYKQSAKLNEELKDTMNIIRTYGNIGKTYKAMGKSHDAIEYTLKAIKLCNKPVYLVNAAVLHGNIAMSYSDLGDYNKSYYHYTKAIEIDSTLSNEEGVIRHLSNLAIIYKRQGNFAKTIEINFKALARAEKIKAKYLCGTINNSIAIIYAIQQLYKEAEFYFRKAIVLYKEVDSKPETSNALGNLGIIYKERADSANKKGNTELHKSLSQNAFNIFNEALKLNRELNNQWGTALNLGQLASIYQSAREYQKSINLALEGIKLLESFNDKEALSAEYSNIAISYVNLKDYTRAENYLLKSLKLATELASIKELKYCYDGLYDLYKKTNKPKEALKYYELYITINDSIKNDDNSKAMVKQQLKYEYEKQAAADSVTFAKASEIKNVELAKQKVEIRAKKNQQYALIGGLGLVIIFAGFMYNRFKITQKQKHIIDKQKTLVEQQKHLVEEKQKEILDSIAYAKRIQMALLPPEKYIERILLKPKGLKGK